MVKSKTYDNIFIVFTDEYEIFNMNLRQKILIL